MNYAKAPEVRKVPLPLGRSVAHATGNRYMILPERLEAASRYLEGAVVLKDAGDYAGAISRCYYAAYQAMWAVLGEPPARPRWGDTGIIQTFVRGRWDDPSYPMTGPGLYEQFRLPLGRLYSLRLAVDYRVESVTQETADWALNIVTDLIATINLKAR